MPRSPTLIMLVFVRKIFCVFRSRCRMFLSCRYWKANRRWWLQMALAHLNKSKKKSSLSNGRRSHGIPGEPWLSGQTTPPPASRAGAHPSAVWAGGRGHPLHRNPWRCKAGSHLLPKTPCMSRCWDVAAEKEAAPPARQTAALAWRRWSNSASWSHTAMWGTEGMERSPCDVCFYLSAVLLVDSELVRAS